MKKAGIILTIITTVLLLMSIIFGVKVNYEYNNKFESYWNLADKSSTIINKAKYIDEFVNALGKSGFEGSYNAIMFTTLDNKFDTNFEALKTLQQRLHEIEKMDVTSFEYQTAIQQITGQEQGEAHEMLAIFKGIYIKENYFLLWNWIAVIQITLVSLLMFLGIFMWIDSDDY